MSESLNDFLSPTSIAIIGASKKPTKRGYQAIKRLIKDKYTWPIYPVHPKEPEILGLKCYASVLDIEKKVDLALICTPSRTLPDVLEECGKKGVKGAVILAGGFGETGCDGKALENKAVEIAKKYNVRLIGPNTSGMFNLHRCVNLVGFNNVKTGDIGIVSQSGNMALSLVTEGEINRNVGFSTYVGVGNQADIGFDEYLHYFAEDKNTKVPMLYIEGIKDGQTFLKEARKVTQEKPVVVFKSGRTEAGQKAASSHTGALAGSYQMTSDLLKQAGVTVVDRSDMILPITETLSLLPSPNGKRVAVLADGGGHATIATDCLINNGLKLAELSEKTRERLSEVLLDQASLANPIDLAGSGDEDPSVFAKCAEILLEDAGVDSLMIVGLFGGYKIRFSETLEDIENQAAKDMGEMLKKYNKPIIMQTLYAPLIPYALNCLREAGVPVHASVEITVDCLTALTEHAEAKLKNRDSSVDREVEVKEYAKQIIANSPAKSSGSLLEHEAKEILATYGLQVPPSYLATSEDDMEKAILKIGDVPMAVKIVSKDILHKSDAGGVKLKVKGVDGLKKAYMEIMENAKRYDPNAEITGVLISPMAQSGNEIIVGVMRDEIFGPVLMFGLGGIFVEVLKDVVFRSLPLTREHAEDMLDEIKAHKILKGVRGQKPANRQALVDLFMKVSDMVMAHPEITEIDMNPVIVNGDGYTAVDARMILGGE